MHFCLLSGSLRPDGNTVELLKPFTAALTEQGCTVTRIDLQGKDIRPCLGCYHCQDMQDGYGCVQDDDTACIMASIVESDVLVLATPIYSWYCTSPMKALLDRHFGLNKYYGSAQGSLWAGKDVAIIATHGYEAVYATEPFEMGIQRLCEHSKLRYLGMYSVRDEDNLASFQTEAAVTGARAFAERLLSEAAGYVSNPLNKEAVL